MGRPARLMIQGTGSDVGKSLLVAGLCRHFARKGLCVRPFKPQNMSNNAAVAADGGEIGRAQALQARAAFAAPSVHMNPVLLKPQSETGAQIVVKGQVFGQAAARDYHRLKPQLLKSVLESFAVLEAEADLILAEGAGSPAEINLRAGDIANMGFAEAADLPVVLVGDIARGGVIASILGTQQLLSAREAARLKGFIVNKFRGDPALFKEGIDAIEARTGLASLGVVPWFGAARRLPAEDAMALDEALRMDAPLGKDRIRIVVPRLPRVSNFDDLDPLRAESDVDVLFVEPGTALPGDADLVLLPGSKATIADLAALRAAGWDIDIMAHVRRGGAVLGLCGGYQMLGARIADPAGSEGAPGAVAGLGLLDVETVLGGTKTLQAVVGEDAQSGTMIDGYEMHIGRTTGAGLLRPMLRLKDLGGGWRGDGAVSPSGQIMGCYVHGLFAADAFRATFLARLRPRQARALAYEAAVEATLDALAEHLAAHLDVERIWAIADAAR